jgi:rifampicin phosphotransferase
MSDPSGGKMIFFFAPGMVEGDPNNKNVLGGKGASLAAMSAAGLPVPPGFTLPIDCCKHYHANGRKWPAGLEEDLRRSLERLEKITGKKFGQGADPLLVSVRSGAAASMPGMLDTILNCGLHAGLENVLPNKAQFWSVYAAFIRQFGSTVAEIPSSSYDELVGAVADKEIPARGLAQAYIRLYETWTNKPFPRGPWEALRECVDAVFESWNNDRAEIYRKAHGLEHLEGTAVNVQSMFPSRVSGIGFSANPAKPATDEIILESSYGLGESVVSGGVTPDRFVLDHGSLQIKERAIGRKDHVMAALGAEGGQPIDPMASSLTDEQVAELGRIVRKVEDYFGYPVDIEWGLSGGKFNLLQSRAIRGLDVARDIEVGRKEEVARLKSQAGNRQKVWLTHNLGETLPTPTPLTWDIVRDYWMRGDGGYGQMYKDLGYRPSRRVCEEGFLELVAGRIYADVDRAAEQFWEGLPRKYDHQEVLANPRLLETAPTKFDAQRADGKFLARIPGLLAGAIRSSRLTKRARAQAAEIFDRQAPAFAAYVQEKRRQDLKRLATPEVIAELHGRIRRAVMDFGKESLKPGFFGGSAEAELSAHLESLLGPVEGPRLARALTSGLDGDPTVEQTIMLHEVGQGKASLKDYIDRYGHRAVGEMELSRPRYREDDSYLKQIIESQNASGAKSPEQLHASNKRARLQAVKDLPRTLEEAGGSFLREEVLGLVAEAEKLLPYRELGKHYFIMGYELLRLAILELGRRWGVDDDVFFLHVDELERFEKDSEDLKKQVARRKVRWQSFQKLDIPQVIDSNELDALGLPRQVKASKEMPATCLSGGVVDGVARIVKSPSEAKDLPPVCVLVCPSTDPSWTALFTRIKGLIVERGGVLSHGAITARDFSIPAVACPDACAMIADGTKVRVDGDRGQITILEG